MDARVPPPLPLLLLFHSIPISSVENVENCLTYCCCWRRLLICERGHDLPTHTVNRHLLALAAIPIDENRSFEIRYCIFFAPWWCWQSVRTCPFWFFSRAQLER